MPFQEIVVNSKKYGTQKVLIDDKDLLIVKQQGTMMLSKAGQFLYVRLGSKKISLHRLIMNFPKGMVIDHINRNTLDNRRENLKVCTIQQNLQNQKRLNNRTGFTGVAIAYKGKFSAQIKVNYKKIHLGIFDTIGEAYKARKKAENKYFNI